MPDYLPRPEPSLLLWAQHFSGKISAEGETFDITPQQAARYAAAVAEFKALMRITSDLNVRSRSDTARKNLCRDEVIELTRPLVRRIRALPEVSPAQLTELGLRTPEKAVQQINVPDRQPSLTVRSVTGRAVHLTVRDTDSLGRRAWPRHIAGAALFGFVGKKPPDNGSLWQFLMNTSRPRTSAYFNAPLPPGTQVWITACYLNPRLQQGPYSDPVYAYLQAETLVPSATRPIHSNVAA